jgi:hypothetical protein
VWRAARPARREWEVALRALRRVVTATRKEALSTTLRVQILAAADRHLRGQSATPPGHV